MPSKPPPAHGPQVEPSAAKDLSPQMQTAMTTARPRPAPVSRMDDGQLDDLLRQGLGQAHDWVLEAPVPPRLTEALRGKRTG